MIKVCFNSIIADSLHLLCCAPRACPLFFTVKYLNDTLSFESKKGIIQRAISTIYSNQKDLQAHGLINLNEIYVKFFTKYRNRGVAERREIDAF